MNNDGKSGLAKFVEWMEIYVVGDMTGDMVADDIIKEAQSLLADEQSSARVEREAIIREHQNVWLKLHEAVWEFAEEQADNGDECSLDTCNDLKKILEKHRLPVVTPVKPTMCEHYGDGIQSNEGCPGSINTRHCPDNTDEDCNIKPTADKGMQGSITREQIANIIWTRFDNGNEDWIKCDVAAGWILAALDDARRIANKVPYLTKKKATK